MNFCQMQLLASVGSVNDMRYTPSGTAVFSFSLAQDLGPVKDGKEGERKTNWWRVTLWGDMAERWAEKITKGTLVFVVGEPGEPQIYQDKKTGEHKVSLQFNGRTIRVGRDTAAAAPGEMSVGQSSGGHDEDIPF